MPTLTQFDTLIDSGNGNTLEAFLPFNLGIAVPGLTIQGIQTWIFENAGPGTLTINGGLNVGGPGPVGGTTNPGVQTLTYQNSTGSLSIGTAGAGFGIQSVVSTINVTNDNGIGLPGVFVFENASLFTSTSALTVNVNGAAGTGGYYEIWAGPDAAGGKGYATWTVNNDSSATAKLELAANGSTSGKVFNFDDAGSGTGGTSSSQRPSLPTPTC